MEDPFRRPSFGSSLFYKDPRAAIAWLEKAFGFERSMIISDAAGTIVHAEMQFGDGYVMIGGEWAAFTASPTAIGGKNTQCVHVQLGEGIDEHCARARGAGALIQQEPSEQFYGDRTYRASDPEGHVWTFAQSVRRVAREEAEKITGLSIDGWH